MRGSDGISRRRLLALGLGGLLAPGLAPRLRAAARGARIVVIGGGFGGATAARMLVRLMPEASVTLVEASRSYVACPFSNLVVGGLRDMQAQTFSYDALRAEGLTVAHAQATDVDPSARTVSLSTGQTLPWDRLVLAPGIDFRWGALEGYDEATAERLPHAWKAGPQTVRLRDQLRAMDDGGTVLISVSPAPFRCPPGPYERASLMAAYMKAHKPRSKLILLDSNEQFSKQPLFLAAWREHYGDAVEWRGARDFGRVVRVDADAMTLHTDFDAETGAVINVVPPQRAGEIARRAGVADATGWCPIDAVSFESPLVADVHVIGDATIAAPMPKSAFSANQQAKVCAIQIARSLAGRAPEPTTLLNTCYSYVTAESAVSVSDVYTSAESGFASVPGAGGISPLDADPAFRRAEGRHAEDWYRAITRETFG